MALRRGTRLGAYEIVAPLGAGGMGEVYRAQDARLGRDVAIKVLPPAFANDPDALARFEREMKTLAGISHPNILAIFDVGRDGANAYAVTELLEGETLADIVARSCAIKADVVGQDETETGLRAILNFGHTIGHGLEAISRYGKYLHGEAISIGQVAAAIISARVYGLPEADVERIRNLFQRAGLPTSVRLTAAQRKQLFDAMRLDKKVSGGEIKFVLARAIGKVDYGIKVPTAEINAALDAVR